MLVNVSRHRNVEYVDLEDPFHRASHAGCSLRSYSHPSIGSLAAESVAVNRHWAGRGLESHREG